MIGIDILRDILGILESIQKMEPEMKKVVAESKDFAKNFDSGDVVKTQQDCDNLAVSLGKIEEVFKKETLEPSMDIYQIIKNLV